jgi:hypothetical protein
MNITAFLQNPWFRPGTPKELIFRYNTDQVFHRHLLARCMTGSRLNQAFGTLYESIHWDNVAPHAATEAAGKTDIDMIHVEKVLKATSPDLILTFGNHAKEALAGSIQRGDTPMLHCHHPNARGKTVNDLCQFGVEVLQYINDNGN